MLTKLQEGGARKCECYWPPAVDPDAVSPLNVHLVSQSDEIASPEPPDHFDHSFSHDQRKDQHSVWTVREFRVVLPNEDGSHSLQERTIKQYQFNSWPDQGVPHGKNRNHLLRFIRMVRSQIPRANGRIVEPMLIHCSAGVGRSGAFIAMDILLQDLAAGRPLDPCGVVRKLREFRQLVQVILNET